MSAPETTDRPMPSERMDAAAERLKVEKPPEPAKRSKAPKYMVLCAETGEHEGLWALLTTEPIAATSRKDAIAKAVAERGDPTELAMSKPERFVVILADQWQEITRTLKPRQEWEELWS